MDSRILDINCEYLGISRLQLMENAGKEVANAAKEYEKIAVFCGTGNNGGDGFAAARHLEGLGKKVTIFALDGKRTTECEKNFYIIKKLERIKLFVIKDSDDIKKIDLKDFDLIVDALVGVGIKGELKEPVRGLVKLINSSDAFKLSVDVPTGTEELKVKADLVLSFHTKKTENAKVVDIGIPKEAELYCGPGDVCAAIPKRTGKEHKGDFGRVLVVGGSREYVGTTTLVGRTALRCSVDIATIYCPSYVAARIPFDPNLIVVPAKSENCFSEDDVEKILEMNFDCIVLGNGLGTKDETKEFVKEVVKKVKTSMVLDADALKLVKEKYIDERMVLTPHAKEFEILAGEYNEKERVELVEDFAKKTKSVVVLKGPVDIISDGKTTRLNRTHNPGMTVGGTGDTLAGIIGGLIALKNMNFNAACAGTFLNGLAGNIAMEEKGFSLIATDIIECVPYAIKQCKKYE